MEVFIVKRAYCSLKKEPNVHNKKIANCSHYKEPTVHIIKSQLFQRQNFKSPSDQRPIFKKLVWGFKCLSQPDDQCEIGRELWKLTATDPRPIRFKRLKVGKTGFQARLIILKFHLKFRLRRRSWSSWGPCRRVSWQRSRDSWWLLKPLSGSPKK